MTVAKAKTLAKRAVSDQGLSPRLSTVRCKTMSTWRTSCALRWRDGGDRYTATIEIRRAGIDTSPVDSFTLRGWKHGEFDGTSRISSRGRFVVTTRRASFGSALRLWADGDAQIDVLVGAPETVVALDAEDGPAPGARWVVLRVGVTNSGRGRWDTGLYPLDLVLDDGSDAEFRPEAARAAGCSSDVSSAAEQEVRSGCVGFEIPAGREPATAQWDAGFETGSWAP